MILRVVYTCIIVFFCFILSASGASMKAKEHSAEILRKTYPEAKAVYLNRERTVHINFVNSKLQIRAYNHAEILHLRPFSQKSTPESVVFSKFNNINSIEAYTLSDSAGHLITIPVSRFTTRNATGTGYFYDDFKEKVFAFAGIAPGVRTILNYEEDLIEPRFLGQFYFASTLPVLRSSFSIVSDKRISVDFRTFHFPERGFIHTITETDSTRIYTWTADSLPATRQHEDAPAPAWYQAHIVPFIVSYPLPEGTKQALLGDVAQLYKWYRSLLPDTPPTLLAKVHSLTDSLTAHCPDEQCKIDNIYQWVQAHIHYIAFEDGYGGLIPREPHHVLEKRYGDCKDMTGLLVAMLQRAGLNAYYTWVGTRKLPYRYEELPTPLADNHMIATVKTKNAYRFLDATSYSLPTGYPSAFIQGKEALIAIGPERFELAGIPVISSEANISHDSATFFISEEGLIGEGLLQLKGYRKADALRRLYQSDSSVLLTQEWQLKPQKFKQKHLKVSQNAQSLKANYQGIFEGTVLKSGKELIVNLQAGKGHSLRQLLPENRQVDAERRYAMLDKTVHIFQLPDESQVAFMPEAVGYQSEDFGFRINYQLINKTVVMTRTIYVRQLVIPAAQLSNWNKMVQELNQAMRHNMVLGFNKQLR